MSLDDIVTELDAEYNGKLPERAIRAAQRCRKEITPRLIDLIRKATDAVRAGNRLQGNGHLFALFLLTEFDAKESLTVILESISLPGDGPFELFGDAITEDLSSVFAALAVDTPGVIDELIANRSLNEYVRWEAAQTYLHWVRDGRLTRDQAVQRLREHLCDAITNRDADVASGLVAEIVSYAPREALDEIKEAFRQGLVDHRIVSLDFVQQSIAEGESRFQKELKYCRPTGVQDTVAELSSWASYRDKDHSRNSAFGMPAPAATFDDESDADLDDEGPRGSLTTIRNTERRVGRNDPCPCGSGKKYKKCCGGG